MTPLLDSTGAIVRIMVTFVDVSARKRTEAALSDARTKVLSGSPRPLDTRASSRMDVLWR